MSESHPKLEIRVEQSGDLAAIHEVERLAFGRDGEADLVDALRRAGGLTMSGVAVQGGEVLGHIAFSPAVIESSSSKAEALALGPLAVLPARQRQGIGAALVRWGLEECRRQGHRLVFLVGHPDYYPRFGFQPAGRLGFECPFPVPPEAFMVAELQPGALRGCGGKLRHRPEFDALAAELHP